MRTPAHLIFPLIVFVSLAGCGGDGGGGSLGTDVPPETVFDEATPEDLSDLCVAISNELLALTTGPATRIVCTAAGILVDSFLISCGEVRSECLDRTPPPEVLSCDDIDAAAFDACDTTVAELETCVNELRANVQQLDDQLSCSMTRSELEVVDADDLYPALCTQIGEECPALGMLLQFDVALDTTAN